MSPREFRQPERPFLEGQSGVDRNAWTSCGLLYATASPNPWLNGGHDRSDFDIMLNHKGPQPPAEELS
jgi:hypothetical protein